MRSWAPATLDEKAIAKGFRQLHDIARYHDHMTKPIEPNDPLRDARARGAEQKLALIEAINFERIGETPRIDAAIFALSVADPVMQASFFLTVDPDLGRRPIDAVRAGDVAGAVQAARRAYRFGDDS
jgi:hypothetical protein